MSHIGRCVELGYLSVIIEILGEEVYNNQNNHKPNNRNRRADEALVDRTNPR